MGGGEQLSHLLVEDVLCADSALILRRSRNHTRSRSLEDSMNADAEQRTGVRWQKLPLAAGEPSRARGAFHRCLVECRRDAFDLPDGWRGGYQQSYLATHTGTSRRKRPCGASTSSPAPLPGQQRWQPPDGNSMDLDPRADGSR